MTQIDHNSFASHQRGFTLVELLICIVLLSVGVVGAFAYLPTGYRMIVRSDRISTMTHLAHQKMDQLKVLADTDWTNSALQAGITHPSGAAKMVGTSYPGYSVTWRVTDGSPDTNMKTLNVTVGYLIYNSSGNVLSPANPEALRKQFQTFVAK
jgi:prepilin-type N-terminal cleavage/methylation domain-containing protein